MTEPIKTIEPSEEIPIKLSPKITFALSALRDVCDKETYAIIETLAMVAPQIILALSMLVEIQVAIDEIAKNNYTRKNIICWVANLSNESLVNLGQDRLDENAFNEKYGGQDD